MLLTFINISLIVIILLVIALLAILSSKTGIKLFGYTSKNKNTNYVINFNYFFIWQAVVIALCLTFIKFVGDDKPIIKAYSSDYPLYNPHSVLKFPADQLRIQKNDSPEITETDIKSSTKTGDQFFHLVFVDWTGSTLDEDSNFVAKNNLKEFGQAISSLQEKFQNFTQAEDSLQMKESLPLLLVTKSMTENCSYPTKVSLLYDLGLDITGLECVFPKMWIDTSDCRFGIADSSHFDAIKEYEKALSNRKQANKSQGRTNFVFIAKELKNAVLNHKPLKEIKEENCIAVTIISDFHHEKQYASFDQVEKNISQLIALPSLRRLTLIQLPLKNNDDAKRKDIDTLVEIIKKKSGSKFDNLIDLTNTDFLKDSTSLDQILSSSSNYDKSASKPLSFYYPLNYGGANAKVAKLKIHNIEKDGETFVLKLRSGTSSQNNVILNINPSYMQDDNHPIALNIPTVLKIKPTNMLHCTLEPRDSAAAIEGLYLDLYTKSMALRKSIPIVFKPLMPLDKCWLLIISYTSLIVLSCAVLIAFAWYHFRKHKEDTEANKYLRTCVIWSIVATAFAFFCLLYTYLPVMEFADSDKFAYYCMAMGVAITATGLATHGFLKVAKEHAKDLEDAKNNTLPY